MLPKHQRLRRSRDISKVYRLGDKAVSRHLVVRVWKSATLEDAALPLAAETGLEASVQKSSRRVGIVVSQKVSKRAVIRNRLKRQVRAIMAQLLPQLQPQVWVVINLRPGAEQCEYGDFLQELKQLFTQLEVFYGHS
ncbi:ribonuclease P protein component [Leptolyngbya sp. BL0902]|uniref:ribonuclease P protein component n=1 Tax=Leptolyngbya sp. BL0902 TaxID=1115757 RepID=UPI0018E85709|nr:ribonuclease P protein component [Leptolyngbya sp. BL0902]QQE63701.1 ribonuclease P protein component [Leptolyngbya sp. BL0902]